MIVYCLILYLINVHCLVAVNGCASSDISKSALDNGKVTVTVQKISVEQFCQRKTKFRDVIAEFASVYCKRAQQHCDVMDKHIRGTDVIISGVESNGNDVDMTLYIRDSTNHEKAALTSVQFEEVFKQHGSGINNAFGYLVVLKNHRTPFETWRIAVITVLAVIIVVSVIIAIAVAVTTHKKAVKKIKSRRDSEHSRHISDYESLHFNVATISTTASDYEYATLAVKDINLGVPKTPPPDSRPNPTSSTFTEPAQELNGYGYNTTDRRNIVQDQVCKTAIENPSYASAAPDILTTEL